MNKKIKLLYIDDEPVNLEVFQHSFEDDFLILTGASGFEGLNTLDENPDTKIVISDMRMPGMTGLEFIKAAKHRHKNTAYFIFTCYSVTEQIKKALDDKLIIEYFSKPFNTKEIHDALMAVLAKRQDC